jgi:DNA transformation protein
MRVSAGTRAFVLGQLADIRSLAARAMFGGVGLYSEGVFFGILAADLLYFKVDDLNRPDYAARGMEPFEPFADRPGTMSYYQVPIDVLEDADILVVWAQRAVAVASRKPMALTRARTPRRRAAKRR